MAITGIPNDPQNYRTVYNPIEYVALSDATARAYERLNIYLRFMTELQR